MSDSVEAAHHTIPNGGSGDKEDAHIQQMEPKLIRKDVDDAAAVPPSAQFHSAASPTKTLLVERLNGKSVGKTRVSSPPTVPDNMSFR